jgi:hypothetical protein
VGRSTLTAGHRCPTCTTIPRASMLASRPGEEGSSPGAPSSCGDGRIATRVYRGDRWNVTRDSGCCHGRLVTCGCVTIRSLPRGKDTKEAPSHGASFSFWKGGEHRAGVVLFGIMLLGAIAGLVITLLIALMIPQAHSPG